MKVLYPPGIEWTIKDGYVYHAPTMARDVREIVAKAKSTGTH
jgi:hypothetical protein